MPDILVLKNIPIPAEYYAVEYIDSTPTDGRYPYIDTGIIGKSGITVKFKFSYNELPYDGTLIGVRLATDSRLYYSHFYEGGYTIGYNTFIRTQTILNVDTIYECETILNAGEQIAKINGETVYTGTSTDNFNTNYPIYLFSCNSAGVQNYTVKAKIYYAQFFENNQLVGNFIPCVRKSDNKPGMYDTVTNTFFVSQNQNADFSYSNPTVPIVSTATQCLILNDSQKLVEKDINFYDYDGTLLNSWTLAELQSQTELPINPVRTSIGLTAQGWNWTLAELKTYNSKMNIGQMYSTTDNGIHIYVKLFSGRLSPYVGIGINGSATINWGDDSTSSISGTNTATTIYTQHSYQNPGKYIIKIIPDNNSTRLSINGASTLTYLLVNSTNTSDTANQAYNSCIYKLFCSADTLIGQFGLVYLNLLDGFVLPSNISTIPGSYAIRYCNLSTLIWPRNYSTIPNYICQYSNIRHISLPGNLTDAGIGAFQSCTTLKELYMPNTLSATGQNLAVSTLINEFISKNITTFSVNTFNGCSKLTSITIPNTVTTIESNCFLSCYGLGYIKFEPITPPTVVNANAFTDIPTSCKFLVPTGTLAAYTSATNYPSSSTYTYEEY